MFFFFFLDICPVVGLLDHTVFLFLFFLIKGNDGCGDSYVYLNLKTLHNIYIY